MADDNLRQAIKALTARVEQLERELAELSTKPKVQQTPALEKPPIPQTTNAPPTEPAPPPPPPIPPIAAPKPQEPVKDKQLAALVKTHLSLKQSSSEEPVPPSPISYQPPRVSSPEVSGRSLELVIGRQLVAWVGAIIILFGVGYFVKYAYDMGWLAKLPPLYRCLFAAGFGFTLIGTGEYVLRRLGRLGAAGLFSAGIGTLYLTAYAAFQLDLVEELGGLFLLGIVALIGFALTWRTKAISIGVLSVLGGYFSPMFLGGLDSTTVALALYLTMLLGISLGLSAVSPRPFRAMRYVALISHAIIVLIWLRMSASEVWQIALPFLTGWWLMTTGELIYAAIRRQSPIANAVASLLTSAWFVTIGCWVLYRYIPAGTDWVALFTVSIGAVAAAAAAQFGPGLETLKRPPTNAIDKLAIALWLQAGVLLAAAIAMQFDGYGMTVGWLAVGLASVELSRRLPSRGIGVFGLVAGTLAVVRLVAIDWNTPAMSASVLTAGSFEITKRSLLAFGALICVFTAALRLDDPKRDSKSATPLVLLSLATIGWMAICIEVATDFYQTIGWVVGAALLLLGGSLGLRKRYVGMGALLVAAAAMKWLVIDVIQVRVETGWDPFATVLVLNLQVIVALMIVGISWWATRALSKRAHAQSLGVDSLKDVSSPWWYINLSWQWALAVIASFLLIAISFEFERAISRYELGKSMTYAILWDPPLLRSLWLTLLWGIGGIAVTFASKFASWRNLSHFGAGLVIISAIAWLTMDTLSWRLAHGPISAGTILNLQFGVGAGLLILLAILMWVNKHQIADSQQTSDVSRMIRITGFALMGTLVLWLGSLEIDRYFIDIDRISAKQTGLSVYWALCGIATILIGFLRSIPPARYAGLVLFGITVVKVFIVDMPEADVSPIYRVLSAVIVGLLLLATSVAYAKFAPRIMNSTHDEKQLP